MYNQRIVPFYMAYPFMPLYYEENRDIQDLEYLQQMYPQQAKKYQKIINEVLFRLDYEGSMIYDEYPDRITLYKLSLDISDRIKREQGIKDDETEKLEHLKNMVQIILYHEIFKRRHSGRDSLLKF